MKNLLILFMVLFVVGCGTTGISRMSPEQLKALAGTAVCDDGDAIYLGSVVRGGTIIFSMDDVRKGATNQSRTVVTCGKDRTMTIDTNVGVATPPGTVTTTTTVQPAPAVKP